MFHPAEQTSRIRQTLQNRQSLFRQSDEICEKRARFATIEVPDGDAPEEWLKRTESLFEMQSEIDSRMRVLAKQTLDAMKQTHRCPDGLSDFSSADFAERITPSSMDADADNGFVLYYDDNIDISDCLVIGHISGNGVPERVEIDDGN